MNVILGDMLKVESEGAVCRVRLNRPEVRNAFNADLIRELTATFANLDAGIRVVTISGEGEAFCAGGDLAWMREAASYTREQNVQDALALYAMLESIQNAGALVVAQVHGACFGGGCGLVATADVAIAHPSAKFAFSEVKLGLAPAVISPFVQPKIGPSHARALFATGEVFGADRARQIGLVHLVADDLAAAVDPLIKSQRLAAPGAVRVAKRLAMGGPFDSPLGGGEVAEILADLRAGDEGREGIAAFLEKRPAHWAVTP